MQSVFTLSAFCVLTARALELSPIPPCPPKRSGCSWGQEQNPFNDCMCEHKPVCTETCPYASQELNLWTCECMGPWCFDLEYECLDNQFPNFDTCTCDSICPWLEDECREDQNPNFDECTCDPKCPQLDCTTEGQGFAPNYDTCQCIKSCPWWEDLEEECPEWRGLTPDYENCRCKDLCPDLHCHDYDLKYDYDNCDCVPDVLVCPTVMCPDGFDRLIPGSCECVAVCPEELECQDGMIPNYNSCECEYEPYVCPTVMCEEGKDRMIPGSCECVDICPGLDCLHGMYPNFDSCECEGTFCEYQCPSGFKRANDYTCDCEPIQDCWKVSCEIVGMERNSETCECNYPDCGIKECLQGFFLNPQDCQCINGFPICIDSPCEGSPEFVRDFDCGCVHKSLFFIGYDDDDI